MYEKMSAVEEEANQLYDQLEMQYLEKHKPQNPSSTIDVYKRQGNYYGINQISKNVNIGNRKKLINGNGFVFGVPAVSYTHLDVYKRQTLFSTSGLQQERRTE